MRKETILKVVWLARPYFTSPLPPPLDNEELGLAGQTMLEGEPQEEGVPIMQERLVLSSRLMRDFYV